MNTVDVQALLIAANYYNGSLDGKLGPKSKQGISAILKNHVGDLPVSSEAWSWKRKAIAAAQLILYYAGYKEVGAIDGFVGPSTEYAYETWEYTRKHGSRPSTDWRPDDFEPVADSPEVQTQNWPHQRTMTRFFGKPGGAQCTAGKVKLPFKMRIAWNTSSKISRFSCHEKVADSATRVYNRVASHYSPADIKKHGFDLFGGCYNFRNKKGGRTLSTHAYGIAIDHDSLRNKLKWKRGRAYLSKPECEQFWKFWEEEGWLSLGRARNFDWMHVQAALL